VAGKHGLSVKEVTGKSRRRNVVFARHEAAWRLSKETAHSTTEIGRRLNQDHTSVMYAIDRYQDYLDRQARNAAAGYFDKDRYRRPSEPKGSTP
jgi:chromosomal replication initiator protein